MTLRDRIVFSAVAPMVALLSVMVVLELALPSLRPLLATAVPFLVAFAVAAWMVRRGHRVLAGWLIVVPGAVFQASEIVKHGGPESHDAASLPLAVIVVWTWLGAPAAALVCVILSGAVFLGLWLDPPATHLEPDAVAFVAMVSLVFSSGFVAVVVRQLRRAARAAEERAREAEHAAAEAALAHQARERFLERINHRLRHPIDAILGSTELLREDEPDEDRATDIARIRGAGQQLLGLVNDMIDLSHAQANEMSCYLEPFPVRDVLTDVMQTCHPLALQQENDLRLDAESFPTLVSDRKRVRQILLNLVSNALKYTSEGTVTVSVRASGPYLELAVRDTGVGIPAEKMGRLFQPFVQLHEGVARRPGIGLGLALSQRLAQRLGGAITAESREGEGSTFTLRLPGAQAVPVRPRSRLVATRP